MNSKTQIRKSIQKYIYNRNRTHYLKWSLDAEWSIRYIFDYDTKPEYKNQFVLKSHFKKVYIVLTKNEAIDYIQKYCKNIDPIEYFSLIEFGKGYRRITVNPQLGTDCFIENKFKK